MDKKKKTHRREVETVTVTMSRPVAEAVQAACEMYSRLHMGQFNDLGRLSAWRSTMPIWMQSDSKTQRTKKEDFYRALENRNMMQDGHG